MKTPKVFIVVALSFSILVSCDSVPNVSAPSIPDFIKVGKSYYISVGTGRDETFKCKILQKNKAGWVEVLAFDKQRGTSAKIWLNLEAVRAIVEMQEMEKLQ